MSNIDPVEHRNFDEHTTLGREDTHGQDNRMGSGGLGERHAGPQWEPPSSIQGIPVHCHDCWKYTDDAHSVTAERDALLHAAVTVVVNGGTLDVKNADSFKAADEYLKAVFEAGKSKLAGGPLGLPKF